MGNRGWVNKPYRFRVMIIMIQMTTILYLEFLSQIFFKFEKENSTFDEQPVINPEAELIGEGRQLVGLLADGED